MARMKAVCNASTGQIEYVPYSAEEEASADAEGAAMEANLAPIRAETSARQQLLTEAKATAMFATLQSASLTDINSWVDNNFGSLNAKQRNLLALLAAVAGLYLRERRL